MTARAARLFRDAVVKPPVRLDDQDRLRSGRGEGMGRDRIPILIGLWATLERPVPVRAIT